MSTTQMTNPLRRRFSGAFEDTLLLVALPFFLPLALLVFGLPIVFLVVLLSSLLHQISARL